jgi:ubiquinol-cytochrome c reductase iron-sulfur subunit
LGRNLSHPIDRYAKGAAFAFAVSAAGSVLFAATYVRKTGPGWQGLGLGIALAALAVALAVWATRVLPQRQVTDERDDYPSSTLERRAMDADVRASAEALSRFNFLVRSLWVALGALGVALVFPLRSLAPAFGSGLYHTRWFRGARMVREDGSPVRAADLGIGAVLTVFPEGFAGDPFSQTLLLRVPVESLRLDPSRMSWAPGGFIAFSKICTHAGCPVGLYRRTAQQLLCPCHQSVFDVARGAVPVSGPAVRALPQLPIQVGDDGFLRAQGDYAEPVGPSFWERG